MSRKTYSSISTSEDVSTQGADKHTHIIHVTCADGSGGATYTGPFYPGDAKSVLVASTFGLTFCILGRAETNGLAAVYRNINAAALVTDPSPTKAGWIAGNAVPNEFYLKNTAAANATTIYFNY